MDRHSHPSFLRLLLAALALLGCSTGLEATDLHMLNETRYSFAVCLGHLSTSDGGPATAMPEPTVVEMVVVCQKGDEILETTQVKPFMMGSHSHHSAAREKDRHFKRIPFDKQCSVIFNSPNRANWSQASTYFSVVMDPDKYPSVDAFCYRVGGDIGIEWYIDENEKKNRKILHAPERFVFPDQPEVDIIEPLLSDELSNKSQEPASSWHGRFDEGKEFERSNEVNPVLDVNLKSWHMNRFYWVMKPADGIYRLRDSLDDEASLCCPGFVRQPNGTWKYEGSLGNPSVCGACVIL